MIVEKVEHHPEGRWNILCENKPFKHLGDETTDDAVRRIIRRNLTRQEILNNEFTYETHRSGKQGEETTTLDILYKRKTTMPWETFQEHGGIKEDLCLQFFQTVLHLQEKALETKGFDKTSYKEIMPAMHIGRERFQRLLDCIGRNDIHFKNKYGWRLSVSNIVASIDWSRRFTYKGKYAYHFHIEKTN